MPPSQRHNRFNLTIIRLCTTYGGSVTAYHSGSVAYPLLVVFLIDLQPKQNICFLVFNFRCAAALEMFCLTTFIIWNFPAKAACTAYLVNVKANQKTIHRQFLLRKD
jgi:hypothetical protein